MAKLKYNVKTSPLEYYKTTVAPKVLSYKLPTNDNDVTFIDNEDLTQRYQGLNLDLGVKPEETNLAGKALYLINPAIGFAFNQFDLGTLEQGAVKLGMETKASSYGGENFLLQEENLKINFILDYIKKNNRKQELQKQLFTPNTNDKGIVTQLYDEYSQLDNYLKTNNKLFLDATASTSNKLNYKDNSVSAISPILGFFSSLFTDSDYYEKESNQKAKLPKSNPILDTIGDIFLNKQNTNESVGQSIGVTLQLSNVDNVANQFNTLNKYMSAKRALNNSNQTILLLDLIKADNDDKILRNAEARLDIEYNLKKGTWYYNPTILTPAVLKKIDENKISWDPKSWYWAIPQIGSSYSEVAATALLASAGVLAKKALGLALNPLAAGIIMAGETALDLATLVYSRQKESASEVYDAYNTDIQNSLNNGKLTEKDLMLVFSEGKRKLLTQYMVDPSKLSAEEILSDIAAYDIKTSNPAFEEIRNKHLNGLRRLYDQNNVLATSDLLESTLWTATGGLVTKAIKNKIKSLPGKAFGSLYNKIGRAVGNSTGELASVAGKGESLVTSATENAVNKIVDGEAEKITTGVINKLNPYKKIAKLRTLDRFKDVAKKMGIMAVTEGTEEGQQWFMQDQYSKLKDDTQKYYESGATNYLKALYDGVDYGIESNLALLGLHPNDYYNRNSDLVNSYLVGSLVSLLSPMAIAPHVSSLHDISDQILSDKYTLDLINRSVNNSDDYQSVNQIVSVLNNKKQLLAYDSFDFIRNNFNKLNPNDIDRDDVNTILDRFDKVYGIYNRSVTKDIAKNLNVKTTDPDYSTIIGNAYKLSKQYDLFAKNFNTNREKQDTAFEAIKRNPEINKLTDLLYDKYQNENKDKQNDETELLTKDLYKNNFASFYSDAIRILALTELLKQLKHSKKTISNFVSNLNIDLNWNNLNKVNERITSTLDEIKNKFDTEKGFNTLSQMDTSVLGLTELLELKKLTANDAILDTLLKETSNHLQAYLLQQYDNYDVSKDITDYQFNRWSNKSTEEKENLRKLYEDKFNRPFNTTLAQNQYYLDLFEKYKILDNTSNEGRKQAALNVIKNDIERYKYKLQDAINTNQKDAEQVVLEEIKAEEPKTQTEPVNTEETLNPMLQNPSVSELLASIEEDDRQLAEKELKLLKESKQNVEKNKPSETTTEKPKQERDDIYETETPEENQITAEENENFINIVLGNGVSGEGANDEQRELANKLNYTEEYENNPEESDKFDYTELKENENYRPGEEDNKPKKKSINDILVTTDTEPTLNSDLSIVHGKLNINGKPVSVQKTKQTVDDINASAIKQLSDEIDNLNEEANNSKDPVVPGMESKEYVNKSGRTCKTLFYDPKSTEPMTPPFDIPKGVTLHSGKELSEFISNSKNKLSDCSIYYVVANYNNSKFDINDDATYDKATIYGVILNGADMYLTAMKTVDSVRKVYEGLNLDRLVTVPETNKQQLDLSDLKLTRTKIIQDYKQLCKFTLDKDGNKVYSLPKQPITTIKPTRTSITIGSFNTLRKDGKPVFRNIRTLVEAGIGNARITLGLLKNTLTLGYGTGDRLENNRGISSLIDALPMPGSERQIGYAGKIFLYPLASNTPVNSDKIPIVLSEKRFYDGEPTKPREIGTKQGDLSEMDSKPQSKGYLKGLPSSFLMFIFELITGLRDDRYGILPLIINQGMPTVLKKEVATMFPHLKLKQLAWDKEDSKLIVGYKNPNTGGISTLNLSFLDGGVVRIVDENGNHKDFTNKDEVIKGVLSNIELNFHWNTDKNAMLLPVNLQPSFQNKEQDENLQYHWSRSYIVDDLIEAYALDGSTKLVLYPGHLEFTAEDFGLVEKTNEDGTKELVRDWNEEDPDNIPTWANWMINHQILLTDLGENAFKDCWIYGEYEPTNSASVTPTNTNPNTPVEPISSPSKALSPTEQLNVKKTVKPSLKPRKLEITKPTNLIKTTYGDVISTTESQWESSKPNSKGNILNIVCLSEDLVNDCYKDTGLQYQKNRAYFINLGDPKVIAATNEDSVDPKLITSIPIDRFAGMFLKKGSTNNGLAYSVIKVLNNEKTINLVKAKPWLKATLGLSDELIFTTDAILKACSSVEAYGMMSWSADKLSARIDLSSLATEGTEYHEAFHYVNLLLHNKDQRQTLYKNYKLQHPEYENLTDLLIEELLAEDYRKWLNKFSNKAKYIFSKGNWFSHIRELVSLWLNNKNVINSVYKNISKHNYKNIQVDAESLKEFGINYKNEALLKIPGIDQSNLDKVTEIGDPDTYYKVCDSLTSIIIQESHIRTKDDLLNLKGTDFVLQNIQNSLDYGLIDELNLKLVQQVIDNFDIFKNQIINNLNDLSIRVVNDRELENQLNQEIDNGVVTSDFLFDKASYEVSKKLNTSFNAKLFFYSIPNSQYIKSKDENGNDIKTLQLSYDPIFMEPTCVPFSEAWNKIMDNLWNIENYDDLLEKTKKLAKLNPFFAQLYERFSDPNIGELTLTQLLITIKSTKNTFNTITFEQELVKQRFQNEITEQLGSIANVAKRSSGFKWSIMGSNILRMQNRYSKTWSSNFLLTDLVDKTGNSYRINKEELSKLKRLFVTLQGMSKKIETSYIRGNYSLSQDQLISDIVNLKQSVVNFLDSVGIDVDSTILDYYLEKEYLGLFKTGGAIYSNKLPTVKQFPLLYQFLNDKTKNLSKYTINILGGNTNFTSDKKISSMWSKGSEFIKGMAISKGMVYPSPSEFSMIGPNGSMIYPISQNNYVSDVVRWINKDKTECDKVLNIPYSKHSILATESKKGANLKLCNFLALKDNKYGSNDSRGYFNINTIEDYISKMVLTENDNMLFPTMGDKPTWYSITGIKLFHSLLQFDLYGNPSFNQLVKDQFKSYFSDEFLSIKQYNKSIPYIELHPEKAVKNYHGKIKDGKMDKTGGNGGYFRYFHNIYTVDEDGHKNVLLLNLLLYAAYKDGSLLVINDAYRTIENLIGNDAIFNQVINNMLTDRVNTEIKFLLNNKIIGNTYDGKYTNLLLPTDLVKQYITKQNTSDDVITVKISKAIYSLVANHTVNTLLSVKEIEMMFTGDPAYYKWTRLSKNRRLKDISKDLIHRGLIDDIQDADKIITETSLDKIKRLSSVLSTGDNLRLQWDKGNPYNDSQTFKVLGLNDNIVKSSQYEYILDRFKQLVKLKYESLNEEVSLSKIDSEAETMAKPYSEINQTDAVVFVSPEMYKHIKRALGEWDNNIELAFAILEDDDALSKLGSTDAWVKEKVNDIIRPLKMVYFGIHNENQQRIPIFDKMAIYPLFKATATGRNRELYDRMNYEKDPIDMVTFDSAVKVGLRTTYDFFLSSDNKITTDEDKIVNPIFTKNENGEYTNSLNSYKQLFKYLRLQLNTEAHEDTSRSLGTLASKIGLSNVVKDRIYGTNKGISITGQELIDGVFSCINQLSDNGRDRFIKTYGKDKTGSNKKFYKQLVRDVANSSIDDDEKLILIECAKNGITVPLQVFSSRNAFESKLIASIGRMAVDINTPGGSAIQNSNFGWLKGGGIGLSNLKGNFAYNNGKKLTFINTDKNCAGSMDVILSINFFRHVVPKEFQSDYNTMRNWLLNNNIIGEKDGVKSDSTGFVYRIPTLGLSSMPSVRVADVLPSSMGDVIVVPDEFTAMTGSDFDVDKLFITTYYYDENGNKILYDYDKSIKENTNKQITNRLLDHYNVLLSDDSNVEQTKGSIDTTTNILKNDVLPFIQLVTGEEMESLYELSPSYQSRKKNDYVSGKGGIAPMAKAATNLALTQSVGLLLKLGVLGERYGLNDTDAIYGKDGIPIADWFSAMINAHVDIAKDPYIIDLNVNKATWSITELLLRCGKGSATFYFLPLEILKEYAQLINELEGSYGIDKTISKSAQKNIITNKLYSKYIALITPLAVTKELKDLLLTLKKYISRVETTNEEKQSLNREILFTEENLKLDLNSNSMNDKDFDYYKDLILILDCFNELSKKANILSELVNCSLIDTKKYGNTVPQLKNYYLKVNNFIQRRSSNFNIEGSEEGINPLEEYFNKTFLSTKLNNVVGTIGSLLSEQNVNATNSFTDMLTYVLANLLLDEKVDSSFGYSYRSLNDKDTIKRVNQNLERFLISLNLPKELTFDKELMDRALFLEGYTIANRLSEIKRMIKTNPEEYPGLVDPAGNITNGLLKDLYSECKDEKDPITSINKVKLLLNVSDNDKNSNVKYKVYLQLLLEYGDPAIVSFTKDLIKYFFLTSNDFGGLNNLFKLVPMQYRQEVKYTDSIKELMNNINNGELDSIISDIDMPKQGFYPSILINIARNNWYDNQNVLNTDAENIQREAYGVYMNSLDGKYMTYFTTYKFNDTLFVTVTLKNNTVLYMNIGKVFYSKDGEQISRTSNNIFVAIPKLGNSEPSDNTYIYEYGKKYNEESDFAFNDLPYRIKPDEIVKDLKNRYKPKKASKVKDSVITFEMNELLSSLDIGNYTLSTLLEAKVSNKITEPLYNASDNLKALDINVKNQLDSPLNDEDSSEEGFDLSDELNGVTIEDDLEHKELLENDNINDESNKDNSKEHENCN